MNKVDVQSSIALTEGYLNYNDIENALLNTIGSRIKLWTSGDSYGFIIVRERRDITLRRTSVCVASCGITPRHR